MADGSAAVVDGGAASEEAPSRCSVLIGTSAHAHLAQAIAEMINDAYGYHRSSPSDVAYRLSIGDEPIGRVLHLAFRDGRCIGCVSSTYQPPWTPSRCGHWGMLAVAPDQQHTGVASALVHAAEQRLAAGGCTRCQIEYSFSSSSSHSSRLAEWYEGRLGFQRTLLGRLFGALTGFRMARKPLPPLRHSADLRTAPDAG